MTIEERFFANVAKSDGACWLWTASTDRDGYGRFRVNGRRMRATHVALMLAGRPLASGEWALHRCDNPGCVRPDHLFAGDHSTNVADKVAKDRQARGAAISGNQKNLVRGDDHWTRTNPERRLRGENHGRVTVSDMQIESIRRRIAKGESRADLAREFGVSWTSINNYVRGRSRAQTSIFDLGVRP